MRFIEYLTEKREGSLYHSMEIKFYENTIKLDRILGTSIQRYSKEGKPLPDPDFKYNHQYNANPMNRDNWNIIIPDEKIRKDYIDWYDSEWYIGVSMTRDKNFAAKWKDIVFEYAKLSNNYKIVPWNWGSSMRVPKREKEEFVILSKNGKKYVDSKKHVKPDETNPKIKNMTRYLKGIYLSKSTYDIYTNNGKKSDNVIDLILSHPLYQGLLND